MVCVFKFNATPLPVFELVLNIATSCIAAGVAQSNVNKIAKSFIHNRQKAHPLHFQFLRSCHRTETGLPFSHLLKTLPKPSFLFNSYYASPVFFKASFEVMDPKARKLWFWKGATLQTFTLEHFPLVKIDHTNPWHFESLGSLSKDPTKAMTTLSWVTLLGEFQLAWSTGSCKHRLRTAGIFAYCALFRATAPKPSKTIFQCESYFTCNLMQLDVTWCNLM